MSRARRGWAEPVRAGGALRAWLVLWVVLRDPERLGQLLGVWLEHSTEETTGSLLAGADP